MKKITLIVAHPNYSKYSKNVKYIVEKIASKNSNINIRILEENGDFDIKKEQAHLLKYDEIFFVFPTWWYTAPWTLKKYVDQVFVPGFGFSFRGEIKDFQCKGKKFGIITTVGNTKDTYLPGEGNVDTIPNQNKWIQTSAHLLNTGWVITGVENDVSKYFYEPIISFGAAINFDNSKNNDKAVEEFLDLIK